MKIFFANPKAQNILLSKKLKKIFNNVISQNNYVLGNENIKFESNLKKYFNIKYALGVNSGTDALKIALKSLNLKKNSEVIIPSLTATATGSAVLESGVKPVIIDVDKTGNMDPAILKKKISTKTKAVIVVHLHGNPANIYEIKKVVKSIPIIEDCAQSMGSSINKKRVGTFGEISCLSFYPTKNLAAIGDGGAIITNNFSLFKKMKLIRQYGWDDKRVSVEQGYNSRLDEVQAAILNLKIKFLNQNNLLRNKIAKKYMKSLKNLPIVFPQTLKNTFHAYHLFVIQIKQRDKLMNYLKSKKIFPSIHYRVPLHKMPTFKKYKGSNMKQSNEMSNKMLSLPIYPELTLSQQTKVINTIKKYFKTK